MAEIVLCCGKVCSGKSTFAKFLADQYGFYHFSADTWMLHFYDETSSRRLFDQRLQKCISMIHSLTETILSHDSDVVLDFGFWKRSDRIATRDRYAALGYQVNVVSFPVDSATQIEHMNRRQEMNTERHYSFDKKTVEILNEQFEDPGQDEGTMTKEEFLQKTSLPRA